MGIFFSRSELLRAGGTLSTYEPSPLRRIRLAVELLLLYVGAPLAMTTAVHDYRLPVFIALVPALVFVMCFLLVDPAFSLKQELNRGFATDDLRHSTAATGGGRYFFNGLPDRRLGRRRA